MTDKELKELADRHLSLEYGIFRRKHSDDYLMEETKKKIAELEAELSLVKKKIEELRKLKDLEKDYPKTPREVIKFYNRIMEGYYGGEATDKEIEGLVDQMMYLLDEDLLLINPRDEYYQSVVNEIEQYKQQKKVLLSTDVADSKQVKQLEDVKEGTTEADKLAYLDAYYFMRVDKQFTNSYQQFVLRKDEDGCWKIIAFYETGGESFDDK